MAFFLQPFGSEAQIGLLNGWQIIDLKFFEIKETELNGQAAFEEQTEQSNQSKGTGRERQKITN